MSVVAERLADARQWREPDNDGGTAAAVDFVFDQGRRLNGSETQTLGFDKRLLASVGVITIAAGFGEEAWVDATPVTLIALRLSGAPVICRHGVAKERTSGKSTLALQPRGSPNHYTADGPIKFAQIFLNDRLIDRMADELRPGAVVSGSIRDDLVFASDQVLETLAKDYIRAAARPESNLEMEARAILMVGHLLRAYHGFDEAPRYVRGGLAPWQLNRACEAIEAHLEDDIGLELLAGIAGCSPTHFSRAFKQSTGMAPFRWLAERRVEKAKTLLAQNHLSLAEVALAVGFAAQPQFTTAFGRATGVTPGQWRRQRTS